MKPEYLLRLQVSEIFDRKYGWSEGLIVELIPDETIHIEFWRLAVTCLLAIPASGEGSPPP